MVGGSIVVALEGERVLGGPQGRMNQLLGNGVTGSQCLRVKRHTTCLRICCLGLDGIAQGCLPFHPRAEVMVEGLWLSALFGYEHAFSNTDRRNSFSNKFKVHDIWLWSNLSGPKRDNDHLYPHQSRRGRKQSSSATFAEFTSHRWEANPVSLSSIDGAYSRQTIPTALCLPSPFKRNRESARRHGQSIKHLIFDLLLLVPAAMACPERKSPSPRCTSKEDKSTSRAIPTHAAGSKTLAAISVAGVAAAHEAIAPDDTEASKKKSLKERAVATAAALVAAQ
ncbi:hypothetical protein MUK42_28346 [Musa troglodytarum]|uniref:Uncharacterized protein n=1 Tax=Musa troglodytarum TaxID=320322 RepID=A0A9E7FD89_9LILI|nr:hypothetical protein MUK42_28346 [Musa troglodytarum]